MQGTLNEEATGVFQGTLLEDMIDTVTRTGRLYCDIDIPRFYNSDFNHPLTYVPLWAMSLPLRKGDKVWVKFEQNDFTLPVLWKIPDGLDKGMYETYEPTKAVERGNIDKIKASETVAAQKLGDDAFIIKTENYTIIRQNDAYAILDKDNNIYASGKTVNISASEKINIDSGSDVNIYTEGKINLTQKGNNNTLEIKTDGDVKLESTTGKFHIDNNISGLGELLNDFTDFISNDLLPALSSLYTMGSPYTHTATQWAAQYVTGSLTPKITQLQTTINQVFPKN